MFVLGKGLSSFVNLFVVELLFMKIVSFESILIKNFVLFKFWDRPSLVALFQMKSFYVNTKMRTR